MANSLRLFFFVFFNSINIAYQKQLHVLIKPKRLPKLVAQLLLLIKGILSIIAGEIGGDQSSVSQGDSNFKFLKRKTSENDRLKKIEEDMLNGVLGINGFLLFVVISILFVSSLKYSLLKIKYHHYTQQNMQKNINSIVEKSCSFQLKNSVGITILQHCFQAAAYVCVIPGVFLSRKLENGKQIACLISSLVLGIVQCDSDFNYKFDAQDYLARSYSIRRFFIEMIHIFSIILLRFTGVRNFYILLFVFLIQGVQNAFINPYYQESIQQFSIFINYYFALVSFLIIISLQSSTLYGLISIGSMVTVPLFWMLAGSVTFKQQKQLEYKLQTMGQKYQDLINLSQQQRNYENTFNSKMNQSIISGIANETKVKSHDIDRIVRMKSLFEKLSNLFEKEKRQIKLLNVVHFSHLQSSNLSGSYKSKIAFDQSTAIESTDTMYADPYLFQLVKEVIKEKLEEEENENNIEIFLSFLLEFGAKRLYFLKLLEWEKKANASNKKKQIINTIHQEFLESQDRTQDTNFDESFSILLYFEQMIEESRLLLNQSANLKIEILIMMKQKQLVFSQLVNQIQKLYQLMKKLKNNLAQLASHSESSSTQTELFPLQIAYLQCLSFDQKDITVKYDQYAQDKYSTFKFLKNSQWNIFDKESCVFMTTINSQNPIPHITKVSHNFENVFSYKALDIVHKPIEFLIPDRLRRSHNVSIVNYLHSNTLSHYDKMSRRIVFAMNSQDHIIPLHIHIRVNYLEQMNGIFGLIAFATNLRTIHDYILYDSANFSVLGLTQKLQKILCPNMHYSQLQLPSLFPFLLQTQIGMTQGTQSTYIHKDSIHDTEFLASEKRNATNQLTEKDKGTLKDGENEVEVVNHINEKKDEIPLHKKDINLKIFDFLLLNEENQVIGGSEKKSFKRGSLYMSKNSHTQERKQTYIFLQIRVVEAGYEFTPSINYLEICRVKQLNMNDHSSTLLTLLKSSYQLYLMSYSTLFLDRLIADLETQIKQESQNYQKSFTMKRASQCIQEDNYLHIQSRRDQQCESDLFFDNKEKDISSIIFNNTHNNNNNNTNNNHNNSTNNNQNNHTNKNNNIGNDKRNKIEDLNDAISEEEGSVSIEGTANNSKFGICAAEKYGDFGNSNQNENPIAPKLLDNLLPLSKKSHMQQLQSSSLQQLQDNNGTTNPTQLNNHNELHSKIDSNINYHTKENESFDNIVINSAKNIDNSRFAAQELFSKNNELNNSTRAIEFSMIKMNDLSSGRIAEINSSKTHLKKEKSLTQINSTFLAETNRVIGSATHFLEPNSAGNHNLNIFSSPSPTLQKTNKLLLRKKKKGNQKVNEQKKNQNPFDEELSYAEPGIDWMFSTQKKKKEKVQNEMTRAIQLKMEIASNSHSIDSSSAASKRKLSKIIHTKKSLPALNLIVFIGIACFSILIAVTLQQYISIINSIESSNSDFLVFNWASEFRVKLYKSIKIISLYQMLKQSQFVYPPNYLIEQTNALHAVSLPITQTLNEMEMANPNRQIFKSMLSEKVNIIIPLYYTPSLISGSSSIPSMQLNFYGAQYETSLHYASIIFNQFIYWLAKALGLGRPEYFILKDLQQVVKGMQKCENELVQSKDEEDNQIQDQLSFLLAIICSISFLCILTILPVYGYIQKKRNQIMQLLSTFTNEKINKIITNIYESMKQSNINNESNTKIVLRHLNFSQDTRKYNISQITLLSHFNILLVIILITLFVVTICYPVAIKLVTSSYLSETDENLKIIMKTGQLKAYLLEMMGIGYNCLLLFLYPKIKPLKLSDYTGQSQELSSQRPIYEQIITDIADSQFSSTRLSSALFDQIFFPLINQNICTVIQEYPQYNTNSTILNHTTCSSLHQGFLTKGFRVALNEELLQLDNLRILYSVTDSAQINAAQAEVFKSFNISDFTSFSESMTETLNIMQSIVFTNHESNYNSILSISNSLISYQLCLTVIIFGVGWYFFYEHLSNQLHSTKQFLQIIDINSLIENSYILTFLSQNTSF